MYVIKIEKVDDLTLRSEEVSRVVVEYRGPSWGEDWGRYVVRYVAEDGTIFSCPLAAKNPEAVGLLAFLERALYVMGEGQE